MTQGRRRKARKVEKDGREWEGMDAFVEKEGEEIYRGQEGKDKLGKGETRRGATGGGRS